MVVAKFKTNDAILTGKFSIDNRKLTRASIDIVDVCYTYSLDFFLVTSF